MTLTVISLSLGLYSCKTVEKKPIITSEDRATFSHTFNIYTRAICTALSQRDPSGQFFEIKFEDVAIPPELFLTFSTSYF